MKKGLLLISLCMCLILSGCSQSDGSTATASESDATTTSEATADGDATEAEEATVEMYNAEAIVQSANLYGGINGLAFDLEDRLYVGAVAGATVFNVDPETGESEVYLGAPNGGADDIYFAEDGTMYWTAFFLGKVFSMTPDGEVTVLAEDLAGANALDMTEDGKLYVTQVFFGDALWEIDTTGGMNNTMIAEGLGGLNGFEIGSDGYIYGPLWFKQQVVKVAPTTGEIVEVVADGFNTPCAVNFDSKGNLFALDTGTGEVYKIDITTGDKEVVAVQAPHLDNLAINSNDEIYITNMNTNGIYEVNAETGEVRTVIEDLLVYPQGIEVETTADGDLLYIADNFAYKTVDPDTGAVTCPENGSKFVYTTSISEDGKSVVMSGWNDYSIKVYDKATAESEYTISGVPVPADAYMLADGAILVLESKNGKLTKIVDQNYETAETIVEGLSGPTYMVRDMNDPSVFYITEYQGGQITAVNYETGEKTVVAEGLAGPEGIAMRPNGDLVILDTVAKEIIDLNLETGEQMVIATDLPVGILAASPQGPAASPLSDIAVSEADVIYFTSPLSNNIYRLVAE